MKLAVQSGVTKSFLQVSRDKADCTNGWFSESFLQVREKMKLAVKPPNFDATNIKCFYSKQR